MSLVDDALRAALDPIDQRCAQLHRTVASAPREDPTTPTEPPLPAEPGTLQADEAARRDRLTRAAAERDRAQRQTTHDQASDELERLKRHRADLLQAARDIADSYSARCDELVQHHLRGYHAAHADDRAHGQHERSLPKRHISNYDWSDPGDRTASLSTLEPVRSLPR